MSNSESTKISYEKPSAGYSVTLHLELPNVPGSFAKITNLIGESGGSLGNMSLVRSDFKYTVRNVTVDCKSERHSRELIEQLSASKLCQVLSWVDDTFEFHKEGKLSIESKIPVTGRDELSRAYTPGVGRVCMAIHQDKQKAYDYTIKSNTVAVVSDGSAVLGLGNIGPEAAMPVMEGKAVLFKQFAGLNAFPICIDTQDTEEIIRCVKQLAPSFGGVNLEDISAPRCFEIEERLRAELDIPVFHDDQHGTAVVVLAALLNAVKITGKKLDQLKVVVNGFGASGVACTNIMLNAGIKNLIACDTAGAVYRGRTKNMNAMKEKMAVITNPNAEKGTLLDALKGADVFLGVSSPGVVTRDDIKSMNRDPIIFALANPIPEILPDEIVGIARVVATGRSDYPNQVNNALCFPGIFKGAMACRARAISEGMKLAAAMAIADYVAKDRLSEEHIIPGIFEPGVADAVASAVTKAARNEGLARS